MSNRLDTFFKKNLENPAFQPSAGDWSSMEELMGPKGGGAPGSSSSISLNFLVSGLFVALFSIGITIEAINKDKQKEHLNKEKISQVEINNEVKSNRLPGKDQEITKTIIADRSTRRDQVNTDLEIIQQGYSKEENASGKIESKNIQNNNKPESASAILSASTPNRNEEERLQQSSVNEITREESASAYASGYSEFKDQGSGTSSYYYANDEEGTGHIGIQRNRGGNYPPSERGRAYRESSAAASQGISGMDLFQTLLMAQGHRSAVEIARGL